jgi:hypothetical protein
VVLGIFGHFVFIAIDLSFVPLLIMIVLSRPFLGFGCELVVSGVEEIDHVLNGRDIEFTDSDDL